MRPRSVRRVLADWRRLAVHLLVIAGIAALTPAAQAATTSRLTGTVVDNDGQALPGVTVQLSSDVLIGGQQVAITDTDGRFAFNLLPPGDYLVETQLSGFEPAQVTAGVGLDRQTQVRITMVYEKFAGEIEVTAEAPVIDVTRVATGQSYNEQFLQKASVGSGGRDYLSVIGNEAGAVGTGNVNVFGSVDSDNVYLVDGLNTTDPLTATFGTNFNFDAIQEVSIQTGGYDAEFGQALGGIVNLVTKSGGNEFSGSLDVRYSDDSFAESGDHFDAGAQSSVFQQYAATLGGPILRDKVWFFASIENSISEQTPTGSVITRRFDGIDYIGKVTWQASDSTRAVFKISGDPADVDGANGLNILPYVEPAAEIVVSQGGEIYQAEINSVLSDSLLLSAQAGINRQSLDAQPASGDFNTPGVYNIDTGVYSVNGNNVQFSDRDSDQYKAALSWFVDDLGGAHEFKGGAEYRRLKSSANNYYTGNQWFLPLDANLRGLGDSDFNNDGLIDFYLYNDDPRFRDRVDSTGDLWTGYLQDVWRPAANLTIRAGVRYDTASYDNQFGTTVADFDKFQPRLGFAWDITGDGQNVVRANWGRFMHPGSVNFSSSVSGEALSRERYNGLEYYCAYYGICTDADAQAAGLGTPFITTDTGGNQHYWYFLQDIGGDPFESVDTLGVGSLKAQYADEYLIGYERALWGDTKLEVQYVKKETRDLVEDVCNNNTWAWGDGTPPNLSDPSTWTDPSGCGGFVLVNLPILKRDYEGWIAKFETRYKGLYVNANYTYSESTGSTEATAGRAYAAGFYDEYPRDYYNVQGRLSDDRRHRFKMQGYLLLPLDFTVGFNGYWWSASAINFQATCGSLASASPEQLAANGVDGDLYQYCNGDTSSSFLLLEPRGSRRAPNSRYQLDLQISKGFELGNVRLEAIAAIVNATSSELGQTYRQNALQLDPATGDVLPFGEAVTYTQPRRYELGFRVEF